MGVARDSGRGYRNMYEIPQGPGTELEPWISNHGE
jgi:hypothetical protein